jgi:hypothetical protein
VLCMTGGSWDPFHDHFLQRPRSCCASFRLCVMADGAETHRYVKGSGSIWMPPGVG